MQVSDRDVGTSEMGSPQEQPLAYWQKLSMDSDPFNPKSQASFTLPSWLKYFELIEHLVQFNNVIINVLAEPGIGKSVFATQLSEKLGADVFTHRLAASASLSRNDLLKQVITPFQLSSSSETKQNDFVSIINERKQHCLLIIDNAHQLSIDILMYLKKCIVMQEGMAHFHITLLGEHALMDKINSIMKADEKEKLMHSIELPTMNLEEVYAYLNHCFAASGFSGELPLSTHALTKIYKSSGGNMSKVSLLAKDAIIEQMQMKEQTVPLKHFKLSKQSTSIGAGLIVFFMVAVSYNFIVRDEQQEALTPLAEQPNHFVAKQDKTELPVFNRPSPRLSQQSQGQREDELSLVLSSNVAADLSKLPSDHKAAPVLERHVVKPAPVSVAEKIAKEPSQNELMRAISAARQTQRQDMPVLMDKVIVMPSIHTKGIDKVMVKPNIKRTAKPVKKIASKRNSKPIKKARYDSKQQAKISRVPNRDTHTSKQHLASKKQHYTVQVLATSKRSSLDAFIQRYQIADKVSTYRIKKGKETWYILAWGKYSDYRQAKQAIKNLPSNLRVYSPWPRSLTSLIGTKNNT